MYFTQRPIFENSVSDVGNLPSHIFSLIQIQSINFNFISKILNMNIFSLIQILQCCRGWNAVEFLSKDFVVKIDYISANLRFGQN